MVLSLPSHVIGAAHHDSLDEAERGVGSSKLEMPVTLPGLDLSQENTTNDKVHASSVKKLAPQNMKIGRRTRFKLWFNPYRMFFTFTLMLNITGIIMAAQHHFPYAEKHLGAMALGNLLCAILFRNELWMRFLYMVAIYGLRSWAPIQIKIATTSALQHVGGIHSGCALSGTGWLIFKIVNMLRTRAVQHPVVITTGILTAISIVVSVLSAHPWVRNTSHNTFENFHRWSGWAGLVMTWCFVIMGDGWDTQRGKWRHDTYSLVSTQELWFAVAMSIIILAPWVTVRKVPVTVELPSPKVAILKFERGMQQGLLGRISRTAVFEYHAFGIVSAGRKSSHHYMICGVQGDFTKVLVADPPRTVWTRQLKFAGVGHASAMFKKGIRICTGTGIGASLSTCIQNPNWFLIWIGSDQEKTFGPTITDLIHQYIEPERMILWDSKARGKRPDSMALLKTTYKSFGAEVIFITSNLQGNREMMEGCRVAGLNAFGTLWDF